MTKTTTDVLENGTVVTKEISPRGMETITMKKDDGIRDYGYVRWIVTLTYNPTSRTYYFTKLAYENHFNSSLLTYKVKSYSSSPEVGANVTNVGIIRIDYLIHTIGSNDIPWTFYFDI